MSMRYTIARGIVIASSLRALSAPVAVLAFFSIGVIDVTQLNVRAHSLTPRPSETATISGRVVVVPERQELPNVSVMLLRERAATGRSVHQTATDQGGRFTFAAVEPGTYTLSVKSEGYFHVMPNAPPGCRQGHSLQVVAGQQIQGLELRVVPGGTITGQVMDVVGRPVPGITVTAAAPDRVMGKDRLTVPAGSDTSAEDGRFRIQGLPPDDYFIYACAAPFCEGERTHPSYGELVFYPASPVLEGASRVTVAAGEEVTHVDLVTSATTRHRLAGTLVDQFGRPISDGRLLLFPGDDVTVAVSAETTSSRRGEFVFPSLAVGTYVLQAHALLTTEAPVFASTIVELGKDATHLLLGARPGHRITGTVVFESGAPTFSPSQLKLGIRGSDFSRTPVGPLGGEVHIRDDWTFEITNVWGPQQLEVLRLPDQWSLKAIESAGVDFSDRPLNLESLESTPGALRVILTQDTTRLTGTVIDERRQPVPSADVAVFSTNPEHWEVPSRRVSRTVADDNGRFSLRLPPGDYHVVAVECLPEHRWFRTSVLETLAAVSTTVSLTDGRTRDSRVTINRRSAY